MKKVPLMGGASPPGGKKEKNARTENIDAEEQEIFPVSFGAWAH
jgi:hypothetical protein